jgi:hypothetical protein
VIRWAQLNVGAASFNADGKDVLWLAPPERLWRFAMLFFDCWQQASFIP